MLTSEISSFSLNIFIAFFQTSSNIVFYGARGFTANLSVFLFKFIELLYHTFRSLIATLFPGKNLFLSLI